MASFGVRQGGFQIDSNSLVTVGQFNQLATQEQNDVASLTAAIAALGGQIPTSPLTPTNLTLPVATGTVSTSSVLSCTLGTWANNPTGYSYQWFDDTSPISGATSASYTVQSGDTSHTITCQVTATNAAGSATVTSNGLTSTGATPLNTVAPVITGTVSAGNTLSCTTGTWTGSPTSYSYQWVVNNVGVGTASTYVVQPADVGPVIYCEVAATNSYGTTVGYSNKVQGQAPPPSAPVNTVAPNITGTVANGDTLTCTQGTWANSPTSFQYQWFDDTTPISGATASTYVVQSGDTSHLITCQVTASNAGGIATATSNGLTAAGNAPVNTVAPAASGTVATGQTLSVTNGTWTNGVTTYTYQWCDNGTPISGGTSSTYTVQSGDLASTITCKVTASNAYGATTKTSNGLVAVASGYSTLWAGQTLADFTGGTALIQTAPTDSYGPRAFNTTWQGRQAIGLMVRQTDMSTSTNPRAQLVSPTNYLVKGNTYRTPFSLYVPRANFPNPWKGWCEFTEIYGYPHGGSPPICWATDDGVNWGCKLGATAYGTHPAYTYVVQTPMLYDQWVDIIFDYDLNTTGLLKVTYNGTVIFNVSDFPNIIASDNTGPWDVCYQVYPQRSPSTPWTQIGPIYECNLAIQQNTGAPSGNPPANSVAPVASGTVATGDKLSVTNGTWTNTPTSYSYQWYANGSALAGETGSSYAVTSTTASANIYCAVTATNAYGSGTANSNTLTGTGGTVQPNGPTGTWNLTFSDDFTGSSLDTTKWNPTGWTNNGMSSGSSAANVTVSGGVATLICPSAGHGAQLESIAQPFAVGDFVEFRANFSNANWPAVWTSGQSWPANGEIDVAELLGGGMSCNYHDSAGQAGPYFISGTWTGGYHTFGCWRKSGQVLIYWDGVLKETITTSDSGGAHYVIMTNGDGNTHSYGSGSPLLIDYVRVWTPAS